MDDATNLKPPAAVNAIQRETAAVGFNMAGEPRTGALLRTLAASKPGGAMLELGTGTGLSTAWILDGMDTAATLITVDSEAKYVDIARRHLEHDRRVTFNVEDAATFPGQVAGPTVRPDIRRYLARQVRSLGRRARPAANRRPVRYRRLAASTELARWTRAQSSASHRGTRTQPEPQPVQALMVIGNYRGDARRRSIISPPADACPSTGAPPRTARRAR